MKIVVCLIELRSVRLFVGRIVSCLIELRSVRSML